MVSLTLLTLLAPAGDVLLRSDFAAGLTGWEQRGPAEFTVAATGDVRAARIAVPAAATLQYQQLAWRHQPVNRGDQFAVSARVRTEGVADGTGAYLALEFLDAAGQRCGIEHSPIGLANGRDGWTTLTIRATAPQRTAGLRLSLILHSHGTAWFDAVELQRTLTAQPWPELGHATRVVKVDPATVVQPHFGGVGFHVFDHVFPATQTELDEVILKRWHEVNPSFARLNHNWDWTPERMEAMRVWFDAFRATGTELYLATWGPRRTAPGPERTAYAELVTDTLEYLVKRLGATNLRWFCLTNELSMDGWGALYQDLPTFADYHRELHAAFRRRGLDIGLLATDASPVGRWDSLTWAAQHMDEVTAVYGGHEYFNAWPPADERFYEWFSERLAWGVSVARSKGKEFILGEFGSKQDGRTIDGRKRDVCIYWDTPTEPLVALQLADAAIASLNTGVYALGNWTFMDFPDEYSPTYLNKWGMFKRSGSDFSTRPHYYAYGLLAKYFRGPATAVRVTVNDPWLRAAAVQHHGAETWSIVVLNRAAHEVNVRCELPGLRLDRPLRRYLYDPASPPQHPFGDLQPPTGRLRPAGDALEDRLGPGQMVVYTTAYDETAPPPVAGVQAQASPAGVTVTWQPSPAQDLGYYRVYAGDAAPVPLTVAHQIGSTIATTLVDRQAAGRPRHYRVIAVDGSGNPSES